MQIRSKQHSIWHNSTTPLQPLAMSGIPRWATKQLTQMLRRYISKPGESHQRWLLRTVSGTEAFSRRSCSFNFASSAWNVRGSDFEALKNVTADDRKPKLGYSPSSEDLANTYDERALGTLPPQTFVSEDLCPVRQSPWTRGLLQTQVRGNRRESRHQ